MILRVQSHFKTKMTLIVELKKGHGEVLNSPRVAIEPDVSVVPPPKRPRNDSANKALGLDKDFTTKELENLDSGRLALGGFPVEQSQNFMNCGTLSVHAPSDVSGKQSKQQPLSLTEDHADPFQVALQDAKKKSSRTGKVPVSNEAPPVAGSSNSKYSLWTCCQQLKDILGIYF